MTSPPVAITAANSPLTVRVTPAGPLNVCPTATAVDRTLTAQVVPAPTAAVRYRWWKVTTTSSGTVAVATNDTSNTYVAPALAMGDSASYFAVATMGTATGASPTVVMSAPRASTITGVVPGSGLPGTIVTLDGTNLDAVTGVSFGGVAALFVRVAATATTATRLVATVPAGAGNNIAVTTSCTKVAATATFTVSVPPTITSFTPTTGGVGTTVTITGTGFTSAGTATVFLNGMLANVVASANTQLTVTVPTGATTGPITVTTPSPAGDTATSGTAFVVNTLGDVNITTATTPTATTIYTNLTIIRQGVFTLNRDIEVNGRLEVQAGATLVTGPYRVTGSGLFILADSATLSVGHPQGISQQADSGAVLMRGARTFSKAASYHYTSASLPLAQTQVTGDALPNRVLNLLCNTTNALKLTSPVAVAQVLTMAGLGNFYLNNQMLTLLSGADGTALVYNQGTGEVIGTATVQRYINPIINPTAGFRYYGSPVRGATAAAFRVPAFAYDQTRSLNFKQLQQDTLSQPNISVGFVPTPLTTNTFLEVGRGYRAAVSATDTVRFVGTLTTGTLSLQLERITNKSYSGWHLVSNPYPSPLNWDKVDSLDRRGLDAAIYVYESTGPGKGYFRSYVQGVGTGNPLIAAGQAFFVRVRQNFSTGRLIFRNLQRVTEFDPQTQPTFNRTALQAGVQAKLDIVLEQERNGSRCPCRPTSATVTQAAQAPSRVTVYTDSGATADFDWKLDADAGNLINLNQQTLSIRAHDTIRNTPTTYKLAQLAVQAVPPFNPTLVTRIPLLLGVTAPDTYTLNGTGQNLPAMLNGTNAYLRDSSATTNKWIPLSKTPPYAFSHTFVLSAAELLTQAKAVRFWLHFGPADPLPVELVFFKAEAAGATAVLRWATASERNNNYFAVEMSTDGQVFTQLGTVAGQGSTAVRTDYRYLDAQLGRYNVPLVYYRLRQVDLDGTTHYSPVRAVAVGAASSQPSLSVYPTVAETGQPLRYLYTGPTLPAEAHLDIFDAMGRLLSQQPAAATGELPTKQLPAGWYWVRLVTPAGSQQARFYQP